MTDKSTRKDLFRNAISKRLQEIKKDETKANLNEREVGLRPRRFTENTWIKHSPKQNGEMFSRIYPLFRAQLVRQLTRYLIILE